MRPVGSSSAEGGRGEGFHARGGGSAATAAAPRAEALDARVSGVAEAAPALRVDAPARADESSLPQRLVGSEISARVLETAERIARLPDRGGSVTLKFGERQSDETTVLFQRRGDTLAVRIIAQGHVAEVLGRDLQVLRDALQGQSGGIDLELFDPTSGEQAGRRPASEAEARPHRSRETSGEESSGDRGAAERSAETQTRTRLDVRI